MELIGIRGFGMDENGIRGSRVQKYTKLKTRLKVHNHNLKSYIIMPSMYSPFPPPQSASLHHERTATLSFRFACHCASYHTATPDSPIHSDSVQRLPCLQVHLLPERISALDQQTAQISTHRGNQTITSGLIAAAVPPHGASQS